MSVTTVISFCSNDARFLGKCIEEAKVFSQQIIIPVCDHFFDGTPENRSLLNAIYAKHPDCQFIEFPYSSTELYPAHLRYTPKDEEWSHHWHSLARLIGFYHSASEWILFLDCDEIPEGQRVAEAFKSKMFDPYEAIRLACYYYVLKPNFRARKIQELSLLIRKKVLTPHHFYHRDERFALYKQSQGKKCAGLRGPDGKPLIHHYSWVRPEGECYHKAKTWGHRLDKNWEAVIREAFRKRGGNFGMDMEFEEIRDVYFDPLRVEVLGIDEWVLFENVKKLVWVDFLRLELQWGGLL